MKQIRKLDALQKDLDKLRCLNEMPEMLTNAINLYQDKKRT